MANEYCLLDDLTTYAPLGQGTTGNTLPTRDEALLKDMITNLSRAVDTLTDWDRGFYQETLTNVTIAPPYLRADEQGFLHLYLPKPTVQSVTALAYKLNWTDAWTPIDPKFAIFETLDPSQKPSATSSRITVDNSFMDWRPWRAMRFWAQATYVGGYASTPLPIKEATRELVFYFYKLREAIPIGTVNFPAMGMTVRPQDVPPHVRGMLAPWTREYL